MCHLFVSRALRKIQKSMREKGSKCATFAQNPNIWTHLVRNTLELFLVCLFVCILTVLCQGPQPIHEIAGYKVLLQSLLPGSLHSLESVVQV